MKKIILSALLLASAVTFAQEEKSPLSISGSVDVYGTANFVDGSGAPGLLIANPEEANAFGLGMANVVLGYEKGKAGFVADLAWGPRADDANMAGAINQMYAYYNVNDKLTVTAGQFNTFLGYEVISPAVNFNYSVSYLFNAGPFSHTGIKVAYASSEDLSFLLAVTNAHAISSDGGNVTGDMQIGGQVGYKGQYLNLIYGATGANATNDDLYVDYTGGFNISESLYLGINAAYANSAEADSGYLGAAFYLENSFSDTFALGLRPEFFQPKNSGTTTDVMALTLTANVTLTENLKLITEARYDSSDDMIIEAFQGTEKTVTALTIAAVYSF
tara:strand:- start:20815 stop:21807 length:993 start_codon:yes stop_codon:yes gene_type:complete